MISDVPNLAFAIGYTNASWTLKCDLTCEYVCRLLNHMATARLRVATPRNHDPSLEPEPFLDLTSGYVQRSIDEFPRQGPKRPGGCTRTTRATSSCCATAPSTTRRWSSPPRPSGTSMPRAWPPDQRRRRGRREPEVDSPVRRAARRRPREELAPWITELSVSEGKHLVDQGDYSYDLFIIQDGSAEVRHDDEHVADLGPGDFFGEMGVLERAQRNATVIAKSPMRLLTLSSWDVKRVKRAAPEVLEQLTQAIKARSAADLIDAGFAPGLRWETQIPRRGRVRSQSLRRHDRPITVGLLMRGRRASRTFSWPKKNERSSTWTSTRSFAATGGLPPPTCRLPRSARRPRATSRTPASAGSAATSSPRRAARWAPWSTKAKPPGDAAHGASRRHHGRDRPGRRHRHRPSDPRPSSS